MQLNPSVRTAAPDLPMGLALAMHLDALRASPRAYLIAMWWRLLGKKVRANGQFASLLAASPHAYALWMRQNGGADPEADPGGPPIIALIDVTAGEGRAERSIASLKAEGMDWLLIGSAQTPDLAAAVRQLDWQVGFWLMPMTAGDCVARGARAAYHAAMAEAEGGEANCLFYADDDLLDSEGRRHGPHFKPDWNAELFRHFDYLSGASVLRAGREALQAVAAMPEGTGKQMSGGWVGRLVAMLAGHGRPRHVCRVLHHRGARPSPHIPARPVLPKQDWPTVSLIVPTRNHMELLQTCLKGVESTDYPAMEIIIVDNDSDDPRTLSYLANLDPARYRVIRHPGPFNFSTINNRAAQEANGQFLCLLNNDIEMIDPDWLKIMVLQAQREDVGAVGAQLLYPDGRLQHAGVVIGLGHAAGHAHRFLRPTEEGYFHRHSLPQFTMAVTAACLVVERERFLAVGGLDEGHFAVAFNDVDLCLRLNQRGWQSLYEPRATLIHHESVTRGFDRDPVGAARFAGELAALQRLWQTDRIGDPFHHPHLSRASEQFVLDLERGR